jgi:hypothetical protein
MKHLILLLTLVIILTGCNKKTDYDVIVYGGTAAGVVAAYSAKLMGKNVLLIEPRIHLGGMTSGGLGATDIGNKFAITGISRDFYRRLGKHYNKFEAWEFEPSVAEKTLNEMVKEAGFDVIYLHRLHSVAIKGKKINSITIENTEKPDAQTNKTYTAKMFIDCTYEGDLMAKAGVSYTIGREDNSVYDETYNGVQISHSHQFPHEDKDSMFWVDPFIIPGDSTSGLCWGISNEPLAPIGSGDKKVQAYNYRLCLTNDTNNFIPISRPEGYDSTKFEILRRLIVQRANADWKLPLRPFFLRIMMMPNGKTDMNNHGPMSTDFIGANYDYPEASYERRREIELEHEHYIRSYLYFLASDPAVPQATKDEMNKWGWPKDEFTDNNHFPFQLYVREARRMIGEYVMTQNNCDRKVTVSDSIGMAAYNMDSHNCQRIVIKKNNRHIVINEGDVQKSVDPYPIAYRSITPKRNECKNLLVPVCLSASHIAYGSIRMEPVFMQLSQVAGVATSMAIDNKTSVQKIDVKKLQHKLGVDPLLNGTTPDILADNEHAEQFSTIGYWKQNEVWMGQYKYNCIITDSITNAERRAIFTVAIPNTLTYNAYLYTPFRPWKKVFSPKGWDYAQEIPVRITTPEKDYMITINQQQTEYSWINLGKFQLNQLDTFRLEIIADTVSLIVAADALLLVPEKNN